MDIVRPNYAILSDAELKFYTCSPFTENIENMTKEIESSEDPQICTLVTQIGVVSPQVIDLRNCLLNDYLCLDHPGNLWL